MNLSEAGLRMIKLAKTNCNVVTTTQEKIDSTVQYKDVDTAKYTDIPCRFTRKQFSLHHPISQRVDVSKITGIIYLPYKYNDILIEPVAQSDIVILNGKRYEIMVPPSIPSDNIYVKLYVQIQ